MQVVCVATPTKLKDDAKGLPKLGESISSDILDRLVSAGGLEVGFGCQQITKHGLPYQEPMPNTTSTYAQGDIDNPRLNKLPP